MKKLSLIAVTILTVMLAACTGRNVSTDYDPELCEELAVRIERRDSLSQLDYARMIGQNEAILRYLVGCAESLSEQPDSLRNAAWRELTADPVYLERFGYMFTIGSALYSAQIEGRLDDDNLDAYADLDSYNEKLADFGAR